MNRILYSVGEQLVEHHRNRAASSELFLDFHPDSISFFLAAGKSMSQSDMQRQQELRIATIQHCIFLFIGTREIGYQMTGFYPRSNKGYPLLVDRPLGYSLYYLDNVGFKVLNCHRGIFSKSASGMLIGTFLEVASQSLTEEQIQAEYSLVRSLYSVESIFSLTHVLGYM